MLAFILIMLEDAIFLKRRTILSMMKDSMKTEAVKAKITTPNVLLVFLDS